jgi:hypothetical protein
MPMSFLDISVSLQQLEADLTPAGIFLQLCLGTLEPLLQFISFDVSPLLAALPQLRTLAEMV